MANDITNQKGRMIHIRLDDATHKRLKIHAAQAGVTIQKTVEDLIQRSLPGEWRKPKKS